MARRPANGMEAESLWRQNIEQRLRAAESAARLPHSAIGEGGLRVHSGGSIRVENVAGDTIVVLDVDGLEVDGTSIDPPPIGAIFAFGGATAPTGYVLCRGQAISRSTFADLFAVIGTTYGNGNGSTTFNVPDLQQRFPLGKASSGTGSTMGTSGGDINHTHSGPSHSHSGPSHTHSGPEHSHSGPSHSHSQGDTGSGGSHDHSFSDGFTTGQSSDNQNVDATGAQPQTTVARHIHTHGGSVSGTTSSEGSHSHSNPSTGAGGTGQTGAAGTGNTGAGGTGSTGAAGTGNTGSANPPFQVVNYIIKA